MRPAKFRRLSAARWARCLAFGSGVVPAIALSSSALAQPELLGSLAVETWNAGRVRVAGTDIPVVVYYPDGEVGRSALVAVVHGASRTGDNMAVLGRTLASRGMVAIVPDMPCGVVGGCNHGENAEQVSALLDWAVEQSATPGTRIAGLVDADRIGVIGHSWGGLGVFLAATEDDSIRSVVLFDPNDDGTVGHDVFGDITVPTAIVLADELGACNTMWRRDAFGDIEAPLLQFEISGSGHCDAEDPGDLLCPLACGRVDAGLSSVFRRYAVAWTLCNLNGDAEMAEWVGGDGYRADVADGTLKSTHESALGDLACRSGTGTPSDDAGTPDVGGDEVGVSDAGDDLGVPDAGDDAGDGADAIVDTPTDTDEASDAAGDGGEPSGPGDASDSAQEADTTAVTERDGSGGAGDADGAARDSGCAAAPPVSGGFAILSAVAVWSQRRRRRAV